MSNPMHGTNEWLDLVREEIINPDRPLIDPHHHLWHASMGGDYLVDNLRKDTRSGHKVVKNVNVANYSCPDLCFSDDRRFSVDFSPRKPCHLLRLQEE